MARDAPIGIAAVERETGFSQQVLRAWERRYGFPTPRRNAAGERLYSAEQVSRLHLVRQLLERGHRPGKIVGLSEAGLRRLAAGSSAPSPDIRRLDAPRFLANLAGHSVAALRRQLLEALLRQGLERFVLQTLRPLIERVGDAWAVGEIDIAHEHLFTEQVERVLQEAMAPLDAAGAPVILLATLAPERHRLGLLMLEALLRLDGTQCIPLGCDLPPGDVASYASSARADIVALSFSAAYKVPARSLLADMRRDLAPDTAIWCGGAGARAAWRSVRDVRVMATLEEGVDALRRWRDSRGAAASSP